MIYAKQIVFENIFNLNEFHNFKTIIIEQHSVLPRDNLSFQKNLNLKYA